MLLSGIFKPETESWDENTPLVVYFQMEMTKTYIIMADKHT